MGLIFRDVYHCNGSCGVPGDKFPAIIGSDGAGVDDIKEGDHVSHGQGPMGSYCAARVFSAEFALPIPDGIDNTAASAMMVRRKMARDLIVDFYPVKAGEIIFIHAISGGVGLIVTQWAKYVGATVISTVSTNEKAKLARARGRDPQGKSKSPRAPRLSDRIR